MRGGLFSRARGNMSKVLGEKIGIEQLDWARFDPSTWVSEVVGYDLTQLLGSQR